MDQRSSAGSQVREVAKEQDYSLSWVEDNGPEIICGFTGERVGKEQDHPDSTGWKSAEKRLSVGSL